MPLTQEQKDANKAARAEKDQRRIESERNQKPVKTIQISIEWRKSRVWGYNPHATARVQFQDGTWEYREKYTCSGCGYDKESTVIAEIFNDFLKYKLHQDHEGTAPYGMYYKNTPNGTDWRSFNGGVGTNCYYSIAEFIGGKFECVASGKSFAAYTYTDNAAQAKAA